ncbi:hypothetical protein [Vibrio cholerae]|uniref:hypothetical protein n=1 Tax=Vibrio cholerae TaxID=666 RepID=UPI0005C73573|nr:hypothetical protein [Vibrio cholerae]GHZ83111.1 hypothetical protein VCSRO176_3149 [Vibrio cholerae]HDL9424271.1 hypothetical protein [Vibrio cholerae]
MDSIKDLILMLSETIELSDLWSGALFVFILAFASLRPLNEFLRENKQSKSKFLQQALDCEVIDGEERDYIKSLMVKEQFGLATGLWADDKFRKLAIKIDLDRNSNIDMKQIILAKGYLKICENSDCFTITITEKERQQSKIDGVIGMVFFLLGLFSILLSIFSFIYLGWKCLFFLLFSIYFIFIAVCYGALARPVSVAKAMESKLEKLYNRVLNSDS